MAQIPDFQKIVGASQGVVWNQAKAPELSLITATDQGALVLTPLTTQTSPAESYRWQFQPIVHGVHDVFNTMLWPLSFTQRPCTGCSTQELHDVFFKPITVTEEFKIVKYSPRFRIPLFQAVFHDAVLTTDYDELSLVKVPEIARERALLWQLYNMVPLWQVDAPTLKKYKNFIMQHHKFFSRVHHVAIDFPLSQFSWLTEDRLVQETQFGDHVKLVANFSTHMWKGLKPLCVRAEVEGSREEYCPPNIELGM